MLKVALTNEVKEYAIKAGVDRVGVVSVEHLEAVTPTPYKPKRMLKEAKSVIVLLITMSRSILEANGYGSSLNKQWMGATLCKQLDLSNYQVIRFLEGKGYKAIPARGDTPVNLNQETKGMYGDLYLSRVAAEAGLGDIAINNMLISPDFGLAVYLSAIITDAALVTDAPNKTPVCLRDHCKLCALTCPGNSIKNDGNREGGWIFDPWACISNAHPQGLKHTLKHLRQILDAPPETREALIYGERTWQLWQGLSSGGIGTHAGCFDCIRVCPVGTSREKGFREGYQAQENA